MQNNTVCSTLNGLLAVKHPTLGVLVREDGMVLNRTPGRNSKKYGWTKGYLAPQGYRRVRIQGNNYNVHRLVADVFIHNHENKPTVDHINRIRDDNRVCNLRWASHKEQVENSSVVLNRVDYGVRKCENKVEYYRVRGCEYYKAHREERLEYFRKRRDKKKQEKLAAKESQ